MLLEVIVEAEPECPRCARLIPILRQICNELNIPLTVRYFGTKSVAAYVQDSVSRTFDPKWVEEHGLPEHKKKLSRLAQVLSYFKSMGVQTFPNVVIRWHDGIRPKEIVIRGYDESDEKTARLFVRNIYMLLKMLKGVVYGR